MLKVSILMMVYNHASFLTEAIESVLLQEGITDWELVIGNDASTDDSKAILQEFALRDERIRVFNHPENIGLHRNYAFLTEQCQGKYIALLEGDDYWIDKEKLVRQYQWMESHPNAAWCFTWGYEVDETGNRLKVHKYSLSEEMSLSVFLASGVNPLNNSVFFRKELDPKPLPPFFFKVIQWDFVLNCLRCSKGHTLGYLDRPTVHWRRHSRAYSLQSQVELRRYHSMLLSFHELRKRVHPSLKRHFNPLSAYYYLCGHYARQKNVMHTIWYAFRAFPGGHCRDLFYFVRQSFGTTK